MSDTPRTDAAEAFDDDGRMVSASFARRLEREIISLTDKLSDREAKMREARECLIDCADSRHTAHARTWRECVCVVCERYRKAAGLNTANAQAQGRPPLGEYVP